MRRDGVCLPGESALPDSCSDVRVNAAVELSDSCFIARKCLSETSAAPLGTHMWTYERLCCQRASLFAWCLLMLYSIFQIVTDIFAVTPLQLSRKMYCILFTFRRFVAAMLVTFLSSLLCTCSMHLFSVVFFCCFDKLLKRAVQVARKFSRWNFQSSFVSDEVDSLFMELKKLVAISLVKPQMLLAFTSCWAASVDDERRVARAHNDDWWKHCIRRGRCDYGN